MSISTLIKKYEQRADYVEVRRVESKETTIRLDNGELVTFSPSEESGYSVRILYRGGWGFASTNGELSEELFKKALKMARSLGKGKRTRVEKPSINRSFEFKQQEKLEDVDISDKLDFVKELDRWVKKLSKKVKSRQVVYLDSVVEKTVVDSFGNEVRERLPRLRVGVSVVAKQGTNMQESFEAFDRIGGYEVIKSFDWQRLGVDAVNKAVSLLQARQPPSGKFKILVDQELGGVFIHEAVGHACESDNLLFDSTIMKGLEGKRVGSRNLTVIDDPTLIPEFGAYFVDDEGVKAKKVVLIKNGVFKEYMTNLETSSKFGLKLNGHARAQSYADEPLVRMSCTYIAPGDWKFEELMEELKDGLYLKGFKGGQVDPVEGTFLFTAQMGYVVKNGEIQHLIKDVSIGGFTLELLKNIVAVGDDLEFKGGFCGKGGQRMPNTTGSPHVLINDALVGGKE
ncbi:MAG: TldD/PmbA family protein [Candidatus Aenigmarchaeota archaeon]|nr:TldD/PmbA family protein [Candidatus Aenigmarchaeota archaeon]